MAGSDGRRGYIYHTAVNPQYRKRGIATALVDAAMDAMKNIGINKVALVVFRHNESGNEFGKSSALPKGAILFTGIKR